MCRAVKCRTCGQTTWSGCGQHVAAVRARVRADQWCNGHPSDETVGESLFRRLFGR